MCLTFIKCSLWYYLKRFKRLFHMREVNSPHLFCLWIVLNNLFVNYLHLFCPWISLICFIGGFQHSFHWFPLFVSPCFPLLVLSMHGFSSFVQSVDYPYFICRSIILICFDHVSLMRYHKSFLIWNNYDSRCKW